MRRTMAGPSSGRRRVRSLQRQSLNQANKSAGKGRAAFFSQQPQRYSQPTSHVEFHTASIIDPLLVAPALLQVDAKFGASCLGCFRIISESWNHAVQSVVVISNLCIESAESGVAESRGAYGGIRWSCFANCRHLIQDSEYRLACW